MNRESPYRLGLWLALFAAAPAFADPVDTAATLQVTPTRCVALHQGQLCYFKAALQWTASLPGDYCLHQVGLAAPLQCWTQVDRGSHVLESQSADSLRFELRGPGSESALAEAEVEVAWVYNARRRSKANWRLF